MRYALAAADLVLLIFPTWITLRRPAVAPVPAPVALSIVLTPGQTRGEAEPKRLRIPTDIRTGLSFRTDSADTCSGYDLAP